MSGALEPVGLRFFDQRRQQEMLLVQDGGYKGWLCYRHPDGQWVTLRKATAEDLIALAPLLDVQFEVPRPRTLPQSPKI